jgi:hypothetical protein
MEPDLAALREDLAGLKRDVAALIDHMKLGASAGVETMAAQVDDGARRLYRSVAAEGERSADLIGRKVEEQPLLALLIAVAIGYIGGRVTAR